MRAQTPTLVATTEQKLAGVENFFGTNALGALPTCTVHTAVATRNLQCLSQVSEEGHRTVRWFCNDCHDWCEIADSQLVTAKTKLGTAVFGKYNTVAKGYQTRIRERIEESDLLFLIKHLPRRKAPGPDDIPNELLQLLPLSFLPHLLAVINAALTKGIFPPQWKDVHWSLLTKKAPASVLTNQRPIALCNTVYKLYSMVINSRLTCTAEENSIMEAEQEGGRRNRSTVRQLQRLKWNL